MRKKREELWQAGFTMSALCLTSIMSGLVDIVDVRWEPHDRVVLFIVKRKYEKLFRQGSLKGNKLSASNLSPQPLLVDLVGLNDTAQIKQGVTGLKQD